MLLIFQWFFLFIFRRLRLLFIPFGVSFKSRLSLLIPFGGLPGLPTGFFITAGGSISTSSFSFSSLFYPLLSSGAIIYFWLLFFYFFASTFLDSYASTISIFSLASSIFNAFLIYSETSMISTSFKSSWSGDPIANYSFMKFLKD